jgi:mono/diheme cytochrome c family protein
MKSVVLTILTCLILAGLGVIGFIYSGFYDVAAVRPDNPAIAWAIHLAADKSIAARLGSVQAPSTLDNREFVVAGAKLFAGHCVVGHGGPGLKQTDIAQGLNPAPPDLFRGGRRVASDEAFWFIKNGVKMTAMPGIEETRSDTEIWSIAAFLIKAPGMSSAEFLDKSGFSPAAVLIK